MKNLSIIIPVGDDPRIGRCLISIFQQFRDDVEIVLIDNCCCAETRAIIANVRVPVTVVCLAERRIGLLRNAGIAAATAPAFYFVDSDCILEDGAIDAAIASAKRSSVTRGRINFYGRSWISSIDAELRSRRYESDRNFAYCPNLVVRRKIIELIGGFDEAYEYGSDGEFALRVRKRGVSVDYNESMGLSHEGPIHDLGVVLTWVKYGEGRYLRVKNAPMRERLHALFSPSLFGLNSSIACNIAAALCHACRWYGWTRAFFRGME